MRCSIELLTCIGVFLCGVNLKAVSAAGGKDMKELHIRWQRLVNEKGQTCNRCETTEQAVDDAVKKLKRALKEMRINVILKKEILSESKFLEQPIESNRIWISGEPLEKWLSATIGQSKCSSTCGESDCRTVTVDGKTYEAIPAELIIRAGLFAGAQLIEGEPSGSCCPPAESTKERTGCCPSASDCQK